MIRAAFFDIDGTLVSFRTHTVPESTKKALAAMRRAGIRLFICTGRAPSSLQEVLPVLGFDFDGYISLNGQLCVVDGQTVRDACLPLASLESALAYMNEKNIACSFLEIDRLYVNHISDKVFEMERKMGGTASLHTVDDTRRIYSRKTYQLGPYIDAEDEPEFFAHMPGCRGVRWNELFVDVIPADGGKAVGLEAVLKHLGMDRAESMAFGDGGNDTEMLLYAGVGVAMGNACDEAKAAADYVTADVDDGGIAQAAAHFGLI